MLDQLSVLKLVTARLEAASIPIDGQPGLDWPYLERWAESLNALTLLREVRP